VSKPGVPDHVLTEHLRGERPQPAHAPHFVELFGSESVAATLWPPPHGGPRTPAQARELLEQDLAHWATEGFGPWIFFERDDGAAFAGHAGLRRGVLDREPILEVLYAVHPERWGRGYATEMARAAVERARQLGLSEIVGFTLTTNLASQRVLQKAGLRHERTLRHAGLPHWLGRLRLDPSA
jgi:ribosomal-protein-alanine N-acetyltransferase